MSRNSLRLRLLLAWGVFIALTLQVAAVGLPVLFERSIARRTQTELEADLRQLRRGMEILPGQEIRIAREPTDPQFDIVFGGRYWQIQENGRAIVRSRSLDTAALEVPPLAKITDGRGVTWLTGPDQERLFAVVRPHILPASEGAPERTLVITTAVDALEIEEDTQKFAADLFSSLLALAVILMAGAWAHVTIGLQPLKSLSEKVAAVRTGSAQRLEGAFPDEVMPLVSETNALLDGQEKALQEARARAGDLAHGLKTPLTIMAANGRTLRRQGVAEVADEIDRQIETMRRHVDRELARARASGPHRIGQAPVDLAKLVHELIPVIDGVRREKSIRWTIDVPGSLCMGFDLDDFNNIAGNLLENAEKWCQSAIRVAMTPEAGGVRLVVEDDGAGIPEDQFERVLRRGERADTSVSGSGLGLAIVNDLVTIYRGQLTLGRSTLGGLKADVFLPGQVSEIIQPDHL